MELGIVEASHFLKDGAGDEGKYREANDVCYQVNGVNAYHAGGFGLLELCEELGTGVADLVVDANSELAGVVAQLIEYKHGQVGVLGKEVDVHGSYLTQPLFKGDVLCEEVEGDTFDELAEVLHHDDVEQLLFASEIIVEQGKIDAGFVCDIAGTGSGEAFLGKEFAGGLFDLFFGGGLLAGIVGCGPGFSGCFGLFGCIACCPGHCSRIDGTKIERSFDLNKYFNQMIKLCDN